jgi:hypothetical protein
MACACAQATPGRDFQYLARQELRRQAGPRGRALSRFPDKARALYVDEKNQIQALDRTGPGSPMKKRRAGTMTDDLQAPRHKTSVSVTTLVPPHGDFDRTNAGSEPVRHLVGLTSSSSAALG